MSKTISRILFLVVSIFLLDINAYAEIYSYVDSDDNVHFTDAPAKGNKKSTKQINKQKTKNNANSMKSEFDAASNPNDYAKILEKMYNNKNFKKIMVESFEENKTANIDLPSVRLGKELYSKCSAGNDAHYPITCVLYFPGDWSLRQTPQRYIHFIETETRKIAKSSEKIIPYNFKVYAQYKDYPVCSFWYSHEFDTLTANYSGH